MQLPADDVTAAVVHTASLLLPDLGRHLQQQQQQQDKEIEAVSTLLTNSGPLLDVAVPLGNSCVVLTLQLPPPLLATAAAVLGARPRAQLQMGLTLWLAKL